MTRARSALAGGTAAAAAAAYWTMLSSQSQLLGPFPSHVHNDLRQVALTFDDGPNEPFTSKLADLLAAEDVHATFFQVGRNVERFPGVGRALLEAGHVIGNHSYSHTLHRGFTPSAVAAEIDHGQEVLRAELGVCPKLYRPPWLARTPTLFRLLEPRALVPVSGTFCHPFEPAQPSAERIAARAIARTRPGSIIIFHDGYNARTANRSNTLRAVAIVIESLRARGFALTTVDRLLGVAPYGRGFDRSVAH